MKGPNIKILAIFLIFLVSGVEFTARPAHAQTRQDSRVTSKQDAVWAVMADATLKETLEGWARSAGWSVVWDSAADYRIHASASFQGSFEQVSERLVSALHKAYPEISVTLYSGNKVVHVEIGDTPGGD